MKLNPTDRFQSALRAFIGTLAQSACFLAVFLAGLSMSAFFPKGNAMAAVLALCATLSISLLAAVWATYAIGWRRVRFETQAISVEPRHLSEALTRKLAEKKFCLHTIPSEKNPRLSPTLALSIGNHVFMHEAYLNPKRVSEFTAVLGHEVAHVLLNHSRRKVWNSLSVSFGSLVAFLAVTLVTTLLMGTPTTSIFGFTAAALSVWSIWQINRYSRVLEFEADRYSVQNLGVSVTDVESALHADLPRFSAFQTHPSRHSRIEALKSAA